MCLFSNRTACGRASRWSTGSAQHQLWCTVLCLQSNDVVLDRRSPFTESPTGVSRIAALLPQYPLIASKAFALAAICRPFNLHY